MPQKSGWNSNLYLVQSSKLSVQEMVRVDGWKVDGWKVDGQKDGLRTPIDQQFQKEDLST